MEIKLWNNCHGGMSIIFLGFVFLLLSFAMVTMEFGGIFEQYQQAETLLQRACNSAVEANILDEYRADGILKLDTVQANEDFGNFVYDDMDSYEVMISLVETSSMPPAMSVTGTVTFSTFFDSYGFDDVTYDFQVFATNYRLE